MNIAPQQAVQAMQPTHIGFGHSADCATAAYAPSYTQRKGRMGRSDQSEDDEEDTIMAYSNTQTVAGFHVGGWMGDVLAKWNLARERRAVYLQTLNELSAMSDRDLADINVARVSIEDIAHEAAYGK